MEGTLTSSPKRREEHQDQSINHIFKTKQNIKEGGKKNKKVTNT